MKIFSSSDIFFNCWFFKHRVDGVFSIVYFLQCVCVCVCVCVCLLCKSSLFSHLCSKNPCAFLYGKFALLRCLLEKVRFAPAQRTFLWFLKFAIFCDFLRICWFFFMLQYLISILIYSENWGVCQKIKKMKMSKNYKDRWKNSTEKSDLKITNGWKKGAEGAEVFENIYGKFKTK